MSLLEVSNLHISLRTQDSVVKAVRGVSFSLEPKDTLAIVGESGSGKSMTVKGIMKLLPKAGRVTDGKIVFDGTDITQFGERQMRKLNGSEISMIFQDPMTSLNPTMTVGKQIMEVLHEHKKMSAQNQKARAVELLSLVGISSPEKRFGQYPHQLSGGMRQRVVIAIALACDPKILVADEPTTALDVTIQAQILELMKSLQDKISTSIILITHNLGVVANIANKVAVMYGGEIVESGTVDDIFYEAQHPYTLGLIASIPKIHEESVTLKTIPGTPPDLIDPPAGCPFAPRCDKAMKICHLRQPENKQISGTHRSACWLQHSMAKQAAEKEEHHE
ncbi:ABC transporter ATP-binding protein [Caproiciproducens faecalis]|uniref:ABC transporter ATP-binding protein n=1 Tax=Caproiciproducens faecalis TaxID=2820301 RepID=A0ABS7DLD9_9FIRM|nr:ABC transporter ATP-binding protein [Caproiciproducens faecalis]MBW7571934.1 ABC transporter ATP-binding protein [Caproiciproducens faecalis]